MVDELVEAGEVRVGRPGYGAVLVAGVDQPVEAFGGVNRDGQQPDIVDDDQVAL